MWIQSSGGLFLSLSWQQQPNQYQDIVYAT